MGVGANPQARVGNGLDRSVLPMAGGAHMGTVERPAGSARGRHTLQGLMHTAGLEKNSDQPVTVIKLFSLLPFCDRDAV